MRSIQQSRTSYISIKARDSGSPIGVTMISQTPRVTEIEALSNPMLPSHDLDRIVREQKPHPDDQWCSGGHWRPANRFYKNKARSTGYSNYCIECSKRLHEKSQTSTQTNP